MDEHMEALIRGLLDKADDVLDGILARHACRAPVAVFPGENHVLCDDGTVWELADDGGWAEHTEPIPGTVADTYQDEGENGGPHRAADDA